MDLSKFATSFFASALPGLGSTSVDHIDEWLIRNHPSWPKGSLQVIKLCREMMESASTICRIFDPMGNSNSICIYFIYYLYFVLAKSIRIIIGEKDSFCTAEDAKKCVKRFTNGDCYVVPDMDV